MTTQTPRALAEEALRDAERATPGPWLACVGEDADCKPDPSYFQVNTEGRDGVWIGDACGAGANEPNAVFIAAARTREPLLARQLLRALDECAEMRRSLEALLKLCEHANPGAFENGVRVEGSPDEGEVWAAGVMFAAHAALSLSPGEERTDAK